MSDQLSYSLSSVIVTYLILLIHLFICKVKGGVAFLPVCLTERGVALYLSVLVKEVWTPTCQSQ